MDTEYRRIAQKLGYQNITAHESKKRDQFRWLHTGLDRASAVEAERIRLPLFSKRNKLAPKIAPSGRLMILGYLMTKRFRTLFGQGNDAVVQLDYQLSPDKYQFIFKQQSSDASVRGYLKIIDRKPSEVKRITKNGKSQLWETTTNGHVLVRDIEPDATVTIHYNKKHK